jgi:hypothetical protein
VARLIGDSIRYEPISVEAARQISADPGYFPLDRPGGGTILYYLPDWASSGVRPEDVNAAGLTAQAEWDRRMTRWTGPPPQPREPEYKVYMDTQVSTSNTPATPAPIFKSRSGKSSSSQSDCPTGCKTMEECEAAGCGWNPDPGCVLPLGKCLHY